MSPAPELTACSGPERFLGLQMDPQLDTFRPPHLQLQALQGMASDPDCCVSIAVHAGTMVAYASFHPPAPPEPWSQDRTGQLIEPGAIEVAPAWRGRQLAERLLELSFAGGRFDATIVFALMYVWHYDLSRSGLGDLGYRRLLMKLYAGAGFKHFATSDREVRSSPANALMARIGSQAPAALRTEFDRLRK